MNDELDFFVLLLCANGNPVPMTNPDSNQLDFFATEEEARTAAKTSFYGNHYGYEIFQMGQGVE